jgi:hypothetical protein
LVVQANNNLVDGNHDVLETLGDLIEPRDVYFKA